MNKSGVTLISTFLLLLVCPTIQAITPSPAVATQEGHGYCYIFADGFGITQTQEKVLEYFQCYHDCGVIHRDGDHVHYPYAPLSLLTKYTVFHDTKDLRGPTLWKNLRNLKNIHTSSLGQEEDIAVLLEALNETISSNPHHKIIGLGVSRGAATWINTIGWLAQNEPAKISNIVALVLEAPFYDARLIARDILDKILHPLGIDFHNCCTRWFTTTALRLFLAQHNPDGIQPIKSIREMWPGIVRPELPIFIIHSQQDGLIPINHSRKLVKEFIRTGFKNVYFVETPTGNHAKLFWQSSSTIACTSLNLFYKNNGLPYTEILSFEATSMDTAVETTLMQKMHPSSEELERRITADTRRPFVCSLWSALIQFVS